MTQAFLRDFLSASSSSSSSSSSSDILFFYVSEFPVACCLTSNCKRSRCGVIKNPNRFNCEIVNVGGRDQEICDYQQITYPSQTNGDHCAADGFPAYRRSQDGACISTGLPDWGRCCGSDPVPFPDNDKHDYEDEEEDEEPGVVYAEENDMNEDNRNLQQTKSVPAKALDRRKLYVERQWGQWFPRPTPIPTPQPTPRQGCSVCLDVFDPLDWCIDRYPAFKDAVSFDSSVGDCLLVE